MSVSFLVRVVTASALLVAVAASVGPSASATSAEECSTEAVDEESAAAAAVACGHAVEALNARTSWETLVANPDGTFTLESAAGAQRALVEGDWVPVDASIAADPDENGELVPVAPAVPMAFSAGGGGPLARVTTEAGDYAVSAPWSLPVPTVDGSQITYSDVLPDVDLVVSVNGDGSAFSQVLVVESPEAADNPALAELEFPVEVADGMLLTPTDTGFVVGDATGDEVLASPLPLMWDSSGPTSDDPPPPGGEDVPPVEDRIEDPLPGDEVAEMASEVTQESVTVVPDAEMIADADTEWPVYIDPVIGASGSERVMIQSADIDRNEYNWSDDEGMGRCETSLVSICNFNNTKRLIWEFNIPPQIKNKQIISSYFKAWQATAYDCDTGEVWMHQVSSISSGTTWYNFHAQMDSTSTRVAVVNQTRRPTCALGPGYTEFNALASAQDAASNPAATTLSLGLRAADEANMENGWKRFVGNDGNPLHSAVWSINYNSLPNTPGTPSLEPGEYTGTTSPFWLLDSTPLLSSTVSDPDGGSVRALFEVLDGGTVVWSGYSGYASSGQTVAVTVPDGELAEGPTYTVRVRSQDPSGAWSVSYSAVITFKLDITNPATKPTVQVINGQPGEYNEDEWGGGVGDEGKFKFIDTVTGDLASFHYAFNAPDYGGSIEITQTDGVSPRVSFTPDEPGEHNLYVWSVDQAGRVGPRKVHRFFVDFPGQKSRWQFNEVAGSTTAADTGPSGGNHPLTVSSTIDWVADPNYDPTDPTHPGALNFNHVNDIANTVGPVVNPSDSFTIAAYVRLTNDSATAVAVSQDGQHTSAFNLGYVADSAGCPTEGNGCWQFWMPNQDSASSDPNSVRAKSSREIVEGEWIMLAGTYDAEIYDGHPAPTLQVYTCDAVGTPLLDPTGPAKTRSASWTWDGAVQVGRAKLADAPAHHWKGDLDEVRFFDGVLSENRLGDACTGSSLAGLNPPN